MQVLEVLERIASIEKELLRLERVNEQLDASATNGTSRLSAVRYGGTENRCKHEQSVLETWANDDESTMLRKRLDVLRADLSPLVSRMPPGIEKRAAYKRYIRGQSCNSIAGEFHYSRQHMYRILDAARARLVRIEKMRHDAT